MRGRIQVHLKALIFSLSALCGVLFATFFFYDGPLEMPRIGALAQASTPPAEEAEVSNDAPNSLDSDAASVAEPSVGILPAGFAPRWQQVSLDHNQVNLQVLQNPFKLSQTRHQAGSESFQYASYLFDQMAKDMHNPALAQQLESLSLQAQSLGNSIHQAEAFQFSGRPISNMNHLQVRSSILYYLSGLTTQPVVTARYNQRGQLLSEEQGQPNPLAGQNLSAFMGQVDALSRNPEAQAYPQTLHLVQQESALLNNLANHLTLRWESTLDCQKSCGTVAVYLRVYTHQTLPASTLGVASL